MRRIQLRTTTKQHCFVKRRETKLIAGRCAHRECLTRCITNLSSSQIAYSQSPRQGRVDPTTASSASQVSSMKTCASCKKPSDNLSTCGHCNIILYCNKECQRVDWRIHKIICKIFAQSPRPTASESGTPRRVILFHPDKDKPEIIWLSEEPGWAVKLSCSVQDRKTQDLTQWDAVALDLVCVPRVPSANHHTAVITRDRFSSDGSHHKKSFAKSMKQVQLSMVAPVAFKGPTIVAHREGEDMWADLLNEGGPNLLDVTPEDLGNTLRYLATHDGKCDSVNPEAADLLRTQAAFNLSPELSKIVCPMSAQLGIGQDDIIKSQSFLKQMLYDIVRGLGKI